MSQNKSHPNYSNQTSSSSDQKKYVNFHQFLNQINTAPSNHYNMGGLYYPPASSFDGGGTSTYDGGAQTIQVIENSTLVPTAAEFVPSWIGEQPQSQQPRSNDNYRGTKYEYKRASNAIPIEDPPEEASGEIVSEPKSSNHQGAIKKSTNNHHHRNNRFNSRYGNNGYSNEGGNRTNSPRNYNHSTEYYTRHNNNGNHSSAKYRDSRNSEGSSGGSGNGYRKNERDHLQSDYPRGSGYRFVVNEKQPVVAEPKKMTIDENTKYTQRDKLSIEIDSGKLECLVCCENIKPYQSIWSCNNCFHILHLKCTTKWATSSKTDDGGWRCPACQNTNKRVPRDSFCFCGKTKNPQYNRNDLAHSCGELCARKEQCEHSCTQLCHPGPCPPCQATVTRSCGCGHTTRMMQCNQKDELKCEQNCEKLLNCELHKCAEKCHLSDCTECQEKIIHKCHCGKEEKEVFCTRENRETMKYSCSKICNRLLACRNHRCTRICHEGECGECKQSPTIITSCPCGKMKIIEGQRTACTDAIPLCTNNCRRPLTCGPNATPHSCAAKCHHGPCPPCNKETAVKCRCGHMDQMMKCRELSTRADDARCKKRCTKKRSCGKHKCNQECCIDIDHICPISCNHSLSCGKHKCDKTCHKGHCPPCYRTSFEELLCECGANVIYPPVPCGTKRPECDRPCSRRHTCDHPVQHPCHSMSTCPPCMILTTKYCHGKHENRKTIPCSQEDFSCGLACNKPLSCGRHKCIKMCHADTCQPDGEVCKQNCTILRPACGHKCNMPCHEGECPESACREIVEVICQCGNRKQNRTCHDFSNEYRRITTANLASSMQEMQRGYSIELSDILGSVKLTNNKNKTLECNEECKVIIRNKLLDIGLKSQNPDSASKFQPKYSDFLRGLAKKDAKFIQNIHDKLTELVKLSKESKQRSRSHSFPIMNREKRQAVHEMCEMFGVESVAYDAEPNRNVVATAHKEKSWLPSMSIFEVMQREIGQRRIPVPVNAWGIKK